MLSHAQGNFSLDDLVARGLLFSTDCSAMMLMEHKESEEIFTVGHIRRVTQISGTHLLASPASGARALVCLHAQKI